MSIDGYVRAQRNFTIIPNGVVGADISDRALRTYLAIRSYVRPGHDTFPKLATVAEQFGLSESYLKRGVAELREKGFLVVDKRQYSGGFRRVNEYYFPDVDDLPQRVKSDPPEQSTSDRPGESMTMHFPDGSDLTRPKEEEKREEEKQEERAVAVAPAPARKRAARLPEGWMPRQDVIDQMRAECPGVNLEAEHRMFVDHFTAASGKNASKLDWDAAWRNWIRREGKNTQQRNTYVPSWQKRLESSAAMAPTDQTPRNVFEIEE